MKRFNEDWTRVSIRIHPRAVIFREDNLVAVCPRKDFSVDCEAYEPEGAV